MKSKLFLLLFCMTFTLTGCSPSFVNLEKEPVENVTHLIVGHSLEVENTNENLVLVDDNSTLAADGLYYVSWGMGESTPYENSDGDTIDLYDGNLYLLLGESKDPASAQSNMDKWLDAARTNYEILEEKESVHNGQSYTIITYNCINEDNPYDRGISAFGVSASNAVCVELTCKEEVQDDLEAILTEFLNNCTYTTD